MAKIPLTPGKPFDGPMTFPPPEGVSLNNTNSSTSIPPHPPVLCSGVLADGREDTWLEYVPEEKAEKPALIISCHVKQIHVGPGGGETGADRVLEHIAGQAGILAQDDSSLVIPAVIPAQKTPDLHGVLDVQVNVGLSAEAVGSEVL